MYKIFLLLCIFKLVYCDFDYDIDYENYQDLELNDNNFNSNSRIRNRCCIAHLPWQQIPYQQRQNYKHSMPYWPHIRHVNHHAKFRPPLCYEFYNPCKHIQTPCYDTTYYKCCKDDCNRSLCHIKYPFVLIVQSGKRPFPAPEDYMDPKQDYDDLPSVTSRTVVPITQTETNDTVTIENTEITTTEDPNDDTENDYDDGDDTITAIIETKGLEPKYV